MIRQYREERRSMNCNVEHYGISLSYLRYLLELDAKGLSEDIGAGQTGKEKAAILVFSNRK